MVGVDAGGAEKVQGDFRLGQKLIPEVEGGLGIHRAEVSNQMVLERLNCSLSFVAAVQSGGGKLVIYVFFAHVLCEHF